MTILAFVLVTVLAQDDAAQAYQIAFAVRQKGQSGVYAVNADGGEHKRLTNDGNDFLPRWSPDGKQIAFLSMRQQDLELLSEHDLAFHWFLYVMDADGRNQRRLTQTPIGMMYRWSPDGSRFLFESSYEDPKNKGKDGTVSSAIYVVAVDGSKQKRLTSVEGIDGSPVWSPDGKQIAFCSNRFGNMDIFAMNADGRGVQRLTDDEANDTGPIWSPDGTRIAFMSNGAQRDGVYLVRPDGTDKNLVCPGGRPVAWGPDSRRLLVATTENLIVTTSDGLAQVRLTDDAQARDAMFSPAGKAVLYNYVCGNRTTKSETHLGRWRNCQ
jgi:Tol biopolymer transport system component